MENKITFGSFETITLLINAITARIFLNVPRPVIENAGTAGWIATIYISILALLLFIVIEKLYSNFQGKDIIEIAQIAGGGFGRVVVGVIIMLLLLYISSIILREYTENMKIIALPTSPISFVTMFFLAGMTCGAYLGIETIVRFHALVVPIIAITYMFLILAVAPYYDFTNLFPLLGNGINTIFIKGFFSVSTFAPMLYLFLVPPFLKTHKIFKKSGYIAWAISSFFLISAALVYSIVIPYPTNLENFLPMFQLARLINYGRFFQRIESVFMLAWAATALMYLSVILFFLLYVFKKTFNLDYYEPLLIPFTVIIYTLSLVPPNLMTAIELETKYYSYFSWFVTFIITILVLMIAKAKSIISNKEYDANE